MATKKPELTLQQNLEAAIEKGFPFVLRLNDKQDSKKVFRAALGHGFYETGPVSIAGTSLVEWAQALVDHGIRLIAAKGPAELAEAAKALTGLHAKLRAARTDAARTRLAPIIQAAESRIRHCDAWVAEEKSAVVLELLEVARACARGSHTHDGKLVSATSQVRLFTPATGTPSRLPYLYSATATQERQLSAGFAHAPAAGEPAVVFHAIFEFEGKLTSFLQLLNERNETAAEALVAAGLAPEVVAELQTAFATLGDTPMRAEPQLPQQLWPLGTGTMPYGALQAAPSIAVYSALSREARRRRETTRLETTQIQVGSGQAQNISIFASSSSGFLTLMMCRPPQIRTSRAGQLRSRCWRKSLVAPFGTRPAAKRDIAMEVAVWNRPNEQRERFFRAFATAHVANALAALAEARDTFDERDDDWAKAIVRLDAEELAFLKGQKLTTDEAASLRAKVFLKLPLLSLEAHTPEDVQTYKRLVWAAVNNECRG